MALSLSASLLVALACEATAWWLLARSDPLGAQRIVEQHPLALGRDRGLQTDHRGQRLRRDPIPAHPLFGWRYAGEAVFWGLRVSEEGFVLDRPEGPSAFDASSELEVLILGGSSVAGAGATSNLQTIPAHLEDMLTGRLGLRVNVLNGGTGGWYSANELAYLVAEVLPFQRPDLVVLLDGYNDSWRAARSAMQYPPSVDRARYPPAADHLIDFELDRQKRNPPSPATVPAWLDPSRFFLVRLLRGTSREAQRAGSSPPSGECDPVALDVDPYVSAVRAAYGAAAANGIPLLHFLQPSIAFKAVLHSNEEAPLAHVQRTISTGAWRWYGVGEQACFLEFQRDFFVAAEAALAACCEGWGGASLARLFADRREDLFYDYAHYTDFGNREIASAMAEHVVARCEGASCSPRSTGSSVAAGPLDEDAAR